MAPAAPPFQHALGHRRYVRKFLKKRPELNHYKSSNLCPLRADKATPKVCPLRRRCVQLGQKVARGVEGLASR